MRSKEESNAGKVTFKQTRDLVIKYQISSERNSSRNTNI